jgi:KDO2-lipid IV(A) lauroyltransferase
MKKRYWQAFVRNTFRTLLWGLRLVPWKPALAWATAMGSLGYKMSARYRNVADRNLKAAYGDQMNERERHALIKKVFQHFARTTLVEFLKAPTLTPDQLRKFVKADSYAYIEELLSRGKGMILVTAHFGNWELLARRAALEGYEFAVVARQSDDPAFNEITDKLRENGGYVVHPRGASPKALLQRLRKGGIIAILPDQKSEDVFVPFFGRLAGTVAGPAVIALKTGAPILPMFCIREPDGTYRMELLPEIDITSTGDTERDSIRIMADLTAVIEDVIRKHPEQWLWMHDRWKVPPPAHLAEEYAARTRQHDTPSSPIAG